MQNLKFFNSKQFKEVLSLIKNQWDVDFETDMAILTNDKGRVFLVNKDISKISLEKLKINSLGLYFAEICGTEIRLSIEASQMIGPKAKRNVLELDNGRAREWMQGHDLDTDRSLSGFQIIKHNNHFLGTGKARDGRLMNYVSKARRINDII